MEKEIHPNYIKASNLIFGSAAIGLINLFFLSEILNDAKSIIAAIFSFLFVIGIGYLMRIGKDWIKYPFLIFLILGLIIMLFILPQLLINPITFVINIAQTIMQIFATYLLFKIPKIETAK